jgi:hypothetical protein
MASIIKADNIQKVSDGSNIIKKCGSTITLGSCGATISLAAGATQTGFGQTYSAVEYCTTAKTSPFTAAAGTGYFINTTCGAVTVTLPASPTAGDVVAFKDYAGQWNTNKLHYVIMEIKLMVFVQQQVLSTQNQSVSLIYVDATKGWQDIQDSTAGVTGNAFITATGGTITCCGDYKIHTFTSDGCFSVSVLASNPAFNNVDYLIVAGGGGGGSNHGGGGGAGGYRESHCATTSGCYTASPLASATSLPVSVQTYPITVGGGGAGGVACNGEGVKGSNSVFSTITSAGGGKGAVQSGNRCGMDGGSGGGGTYTSPLNPAGSGNTPPTSPAQGQNGGNGIPYSPGASGGGGGAVEQGVAGVPGTAGRGGAGTPTSITGSAVSYAGGGGGAETSYGVSQGAASPCGTGGAGSSGPGVVGFAGTTNRGGGGGGGYSAPGTNGGAGGSGVVIIRYKYQ